MTVEVLIDKDNAIGKRVIAGARTGVITFGIGVQVLGATDFGGYLAKPSAVVKLSAIDLDKINMVKHDRVALLVNGPVNLEARLHGIGHVIGIALAKERLEPIVSVSSAHVHRGVGQTRPTECKHLILNPCGPVGLVMESIAPHVALGKVSVVGHPMDILDIIDKPPACMRHTFFFFIRFIVSHLKTMNTAVIVCALDFIPLVAGAGDTIMVLIHTHHDDARLTTAAQHIGNGIALHGVTIDFHVIVVLVDHGVVEAEDDIAAIATQSHATGCRSTQLCLKISHDTVTGKSRLIGRCHCIDKLTGCRQIVIHTGNVG